MAKEHEPKEKKITPEQILGKRDEIIDRKRLKVLSTFDTFQKTSGKKDVSLCESPEGAQIILRTGEVRPKTFFPNGFRGDYIVIPKIFESSLDKPSYELEEYLDGSLVSDVDKKGSADGQIDLKILDKLLSAFWEFQHIGQSLGLEQKFSIEKIHKRLEKARLFLNNPEVVKTITSENENFWAGTYPSKWKFAPDNLIITKDNKIGFIDNAKVGLRYFGYDLGMLIWPRWVEMKTENYSKVEEHMKYLEKFKNMVLKKRPKGFDIAQNFEKCFWLMIFERLIGAIFDIARDVRHLADWGMGKNDPPERKQKHLKFLNSLLELVIAKLK